MLRLFTDTNGSDFSDEIRNALKIMGVENFLLPLIVSLKKKCVSLLYSLLLRLQLS